MHFSVSGPLRPALKKGGPLDLTFGFQACPAPSLCGRRQTYTGLAGQNRGRAIKSWRIVANSAISKP